MHPQIIQNKPGLCPICGMELIPITTIQIEFDDIDPNAIQMSQSAIKLADIQTSIVERGIPKKTILLLGKIQADERNIAKLTARFGGRIEKLFVNYSGQNVKKGQKIGIIYSPDLITAQMELLEAIKYKERNPSFYKASRNKLKLWNLTNVQIDAIEKNENPKLYFDILSPMSGTVSKRHVAIGDYVKEGSAMFEIIDLSNVWVMFDAYESDLPWIKIGDKVDFTLQSLPGEKYTSKVSYINPFIDAKTRIAKVRVEIENKNKAFKPKMFANGILESNIAKSSDELIIPKSAILWTGKRSVVYVKVPDTKVPTFLYREIVLGPKVGNFYVIEKGLSEGEEIATNGVFKIDASAQLSGKKSMMNPEGGKVSLGHNHESHVMRVKKVSTINFKNVSDSFKIQLGDFVNNYLNMKDAFVSSDEKLVEAEGKKVLNSLVKIDMALLKGDAHIEWMKLLKPFSKNLTGIIDMKGVDMKRNHFSVVSNKLIEAIDKYGIEIDKPMYLLFCPMAFNNKGGFWISDSKKIQNPYFGDKMLKCGELKRELNQ